MRFSSTTRSTPGPPVVLDDRHAPVGAGLADGHEAERTVEPDGAGVLRTGDGAKLPAALRDGPRGEVIVEASRESEVAMGVAHADQVDVGEGSGRDEAEEVRDDLLALANDVSAVAELVEKHRVMLGAHAVVAPERGQLRHDLVVIALVQVLYLFAHFWRPGFAKGITVWRNPEV